MTGAGKHERGRLAQVGLVLALLAGSVALLAYLSRHAAPREHRRAGNEVAAVGGLKLIATHQELFRSSAAAGTPRYAKSLGELGAHAARVEARWRNDPTTGDPSHTIDQVLATGTRHGYLFTVTSAADAAWSATAAPAKPGETGHRSFYVDRSGVIRFATNGPADGTSARWDRLTNRWPSPQYDPE